MPDNDEAFITHYYKKKLTTESTTQQKLMFWPKVTSQPNFSKMYEREGKV